MSHLISQAENGSPTLRRKSATQPSNLNANLIQKQPHRCMQKQCLAKHLSTPRPSQHITLATTDVNKYKIYLLKDIFHILWKILILYSFSKPILQNSQSFKNDLTCMCVHVCVCVCMHTHVPICAQLSKSFPHGLQSVRLLCPSDFPGKNTAVACLFLLQRIFLTSGWNPHLLRWQADLPLSHLGSKTVYMNKYD